MKRTYENAACVLVLDSSIQACDTNHIDVFEAFARIFTSRWMRRLWTLQEAALAKELVVQFADGTINLHRLRNYIVHIGIPILNNAALNWDMAEAYATLKIFNAGTPGYTPRYNIGDIAKELQYRDVTVPSDEPLCIATLLNIDVDKILQGPEDLRMHRLWLNMPSAFMGVPRSIIFNSAPKLKKKGFRWASSTFLVRTKHTYNIILTSKDPSFQGHPTPEGLLVQIPGIIISFPGTPKALHRSFLKLQDPLSGDTCFVKINGDVWYKMTPFKTMQPESIEAQKKSKIHDLIQGDSEDCVILTSSNIELISTDGLCHALFAKRLHMRDGVTFAEARRTCVISVVRRMGNEMMRAADQCAQALLQDKTVLSRVGAESLLNEEDLNAGMAVLERMIREKGGRGSSRCCYR